MSNHEFRSTGRTTRRLLSCLNLALTNVGSWVEVMDHNDLETSHLLLAKRVSDHLKMMAVDHELDRTKVRVKPIRKRKRV